MITLLLPVLVACTADPPGHQQLAEPLVDVLTSPGATAELGGQAIDFELETVDGTFRLWDHVGDVIVLDLSGFT